jgi:single-stranded-DNA-specific exonuclease
MLLRARGGAEARAMATRVDTCNVRRRELQESTVAEAHALLVADPKTPTRKGIVVAHDGWLHGIVGIAANGIVEHYRRAALVVAIDRATGEARGSARTFGDVDVHAALHECRELLRRYGGHRAAAGVSLETSRVPELVEMFDRAVAEQISRAGGDEGSLDELHDGELSLAQIDDDLMQMLGRLAPFGVGFPAPRFVCEDVEVVSERLLRGRHLSLRLRQGRAYAQAIAFSYNGPEVSIGDRIGFLFVPSYNHFRGRMRLQLQVDRVWRCSR